MPLILQISLIVISFIFLFILISMVKRKRIMLKHAIFWGSLVFLMVLSTIFIEHVKTIANYFGIEVASNFIFFCAFLVLFIIIFLILSSLSRARQDITKLVQEIAIINHKLEKYNVKNNNK